MNGDSKMRVATSTVGKWLYVSNEGLKSEAFAVFVSIFIGWMAASAIRHNFFALDWLSRKATFPLRPNVLFDTFTPLVLLLTLILAACFKSVLTPYLRSVYLTIIRLTILAGLLVGLTSYEVTYGWGIGARSLILALSGLVLTWLSACAYYYAPKPRELPKDTIHHKRFVEIILGYVESKKQIIALEGRYGDGKTWLVNALENELRKQKDKYIVVRVSSWLPATQRALATAVYESIAAEVSKVYPGRLVHKRFREIATAVIEGLPQTGQMLKLFIKTKSQEDVLRDLGALLSRIQHRVVVLVDDVDRMSKDELVVLLRILRAPEAEEFPNLTYLCALSKTAVARILSPGASRKKEADILAYLEKFFVTQVQIPSIQPYILEVLYGEKLDALLVENQIDVDLSNAETSYKFQKLWIRIFSKKLTNVRAVDLFFEHTSVVAKLLRDEVFLSDLLCMVALREWYPSIHSLIYKMREYVTDSNALGYQYYFLSQGDEKLLTSRRKEFWKVLKKEISDSSERWLVGDLLYEVFPNFMATVGWGRPIVQSAEVTLKQRLIRHPQVFQRYSAFMLAPTEVSSSEVHKVVEEINQATSLERVEEILAKYEGPKVPTDLTAEMYAFLADAASEIRYGSSLLLSEAVVNRMSSENITGGWFGLSFSRRRLLIKIFSSIDESLRELYVVLLIKSAKDIDVASEIYSTFAEREFPDFSTADLPKENIRREFVERADRDALNEGGKGLLAAKAPLGILYRYASANGERLRDELTRVLGANKLLLRKFMGWMNEASFQGSPREALAKLVHIEGLELAIAALQLSENDIQVIAGFRVKFALE